MDFTEELKVVFQELEFLSGLEKVVVTELSNKSTADKIKHFEELKVLTGEQLQVVQKCLLNYDALIQEHIENQIEMLKKKK
jgi:hypothetical protein